MAQESAVDISVIGKYFSAF